MRGKGLAYGMGARQKGVSKWKDGRVLYIWVLPVNGGGWVVAVRVVCRLYANQHSTPGVRTCVGTLVSVAGASLGVGWE